ncbi:MAG: CocE/NonD family hydrolase [Promethearchaeia archaeon]
METKNRIDYRRLKLDIRPIVPPPLIRLGKGLLKYIGSPLIKVLGPLLGFGKAKHKVIRLEEIFVEMDDGTKLATSVYLPQKVYEDKEKCPTILVRLPYWKDGMYSIFGYAFSSYGYTVVLQDARGCAHSEGFNFFLMTERMDGLKTLKWVTKQFWYNGKIGMSGGSYFGMTQLCVSWDNPYLSCIAPAICCISNLWKDHQGLNINSLTTSIYRIMINVSANREEPLVNLITDEMLELYLNPIYALYNESLHKPGKYLKFSNFTEKSIDKCIEILADFYKIKKFDLGKRNFSIYFKFLKDFLYLEKDIDNMPGMLDIDLKNVSQPVFMQAGWYDMFLEHQVKDFLKLKKEASGEVKKYSKLVVGPWGHANKGHPEGSLVDFLKDFLKIEWFDYWLKGDKEAFPEIDKPSIKYWVLGLNQWRYTDVWPPKETEMKELYLHSGGYANSVEGDGTLNIRKPKKEKEDNYIFDPMNPVITRGGRNLGILIGGQDQKNAEKRDDVLIYTSDILKEGLEISGEVKVILYAASSAKDTDFMAKLVDVYPNGKAINLLDAGVRARYRKGEDEEPTLVQPGKVYEYEIKLGNISNYFRPRHRIRLEISSSNFPRFDINANLGGEKSLKGYKMAVQSIFHTEKQPSRLILPVFQNNSK